MRISQCLIVSIVELKWGEVQGAPVRSDMFNCIYSRIEINIKVLPAGKILGFNCIYSRIEMQQTKLIALSVFISFNCIYSRIEIFKRALQKRATTELFNCIYSRIEMKT